jgi:cell division protein FtsQ
LIVLLFSTLGFVEQRKSSVKCLGLKIDIDRSDNNYFVLEEDIENLIQNKGYDVDSLLVPNFDVAQIERLLNNNPSIKNAEVYTTIDGYIKVDVEQRKPLLRVFSKNNDSYYIDNEGWLMPLSNKYTSNIVVANGDIFPQDSANYQANVTLLEKSHILHQLYDITAFLSADEFWKSQIVQIYVNEKNNVELIPRVGNHIIIIGDATNLKEKLEKLMIFYEKGLSKTGWNEYSTINLKYKNQVVCTKR